MAKRRRTLPVLIGLAIPIAFVGGLAWFTYAHVRQERLNRALIERIDLFGPLDQQAGADQTDAVVRLLREGADPNARVRTDEGSTSFWDLLKTPFGRRRDRALGPPALMLAIEQGNPAIAEALVEHGADVNTTDTDGTSALAAAASNVELDLVETLLRRGAKDVNARASWESGTATSPQGLSWNVHGEPLLCWAVEWQYIDIVQLLLDRQADVDARDGEGRTALMWAAFMLDEDTTRLLLVHGADVRVRDRHGDTALRVARKLNPTGFERDVIKLLQQAGAKE